jgi:ATP-dependent DNA ligase
MYWLDRQRFYSRAGCTTTRNLSARPLHDRRARLDDVAAGSELVFPVRRLAPDGLEVWKQVVERGYEGYVAKDEASAYEGGATRR